MGLSDKEAGGAIYNDHEGGTREGEDQELCLAMWLLSGQRGIHKETWERRAETVVWTEGDSSGAERLICEL